MGEVHIGLNAEHSRSSDKPFESEPTAWPRRRRLVCMTIALLGLAVSGMADSVVAAETDVVSLFNGRDRDNWDGAHGVIHCPLGGQRRMCIRDREARHVLRPRPTTDR